MKKYALVVGISKYQDADINDLPLVSRDAEGMRRCLETDCEFDAVRLLGGRAGKESVSSGDIARELGRIADQIEAKDTFLFYFAGHGTRSEGQSRLLTSDAVLRMKDLSFSVEQLKNSLDKVDCAQKVLIFDCCRKDPHHSRGEDEALATGGFVRDIATLAETDEGAASTTCTMFSCSKGERSYEWPEKGHGVFTHFLIEGLGKKAWSEEGRLTIQNVGKYVQEGVAKWSEKRSRQQTPWIQYSGTMGGEVVLAEKPGKVGLKKEDDAGKRSGDVDHIKETIRREHAEEEAKRAGERVEEAKKERAEAEERAAVAEKKSKEAVGRAAAAEKALREAQTGKALEEAEAELKAAIADASKAVADRPRRPARRQSSAWDPLPPAAAARARTAGRRKSRAKGFSPPSRSESSISSKVGKRASRHRKPPDSDSGLPIGLIGVGGVLFLVALVVCVFMFWWRDIVIGIGIIIGLGIVFAALEELFEMVLGLLVLIVIVSVIYYIYSAW